MVVTNDYYSSYFLHCLSLLGLVSTVASQPLLPNKQVVLLPLSSMDLFCEWSMTNIIIRIISIVTLNTNSHILIQILTEKLLSYTRFLKEYVYS